MWRVRLKEKLSDWRVVLSLALVPLLIAVALLAYHQFAQGMRYDKAYFSQDHLSRYASVANLLGDMELALQNGDADLMAAVRAIRGGPTPVQINPYLKFGVLLDKKGEYFNYLYFDNRNYRRYLKPVRQVDGRYVLAPLDLYYFMDSGRWLYVWGPLAALWWIALTVVSGGMTFHRAMERLRRRMFGGGRLSAP